MMIYVQSSHQMCVAAHDLPWSCVHIWPMAPRILGLHKDCRRDQIWPLHNLRLGLSIWGNMGKDNAHGAWKFTWFHMSKCAWARMRLALSCKIRVCTPDASMVQLDKPLPVFCADQRYINMEESRGMIMYLVSSLFLDLLHSSSNTCTLHNVCLQSLRFCLCNVCRSRHWHQHGWHGRCLRVHARTVPSPAEL